MTTKKKKSEPPAVFTKAALMGSGRFDNRKDALAAVIQDGEEVTIEEAQARLAKFMKRKVR